MVYIRSVHLSGGTRHEHIASVRWEDPDDGNSGQSSRSEMVDFIGNKGGAAYVSDGSRAARVGVVDATPPYIRTYADGVWTDNLLALPRY